CGESFQPFGGLQSDLESGFDEMLVDGSPSIHRRLAGEGAGSFQATLNGHQTKFEREVVGVNRIETKQASLFEKEQTMTAQLSQRRWTRLSIQQERNEVITRRTHASVLMIDDSNSFLRIDHEV